MSLLPQNQVKDDEVPIKDHHDVLPNVGPYGHCDFLAEPLPFDFPDHPLEYMGSGPAFSAPFSTQEPQPYTQEGLEVGPYPVYSSSNDPMVREVNGCFSPHPASIRIPQSNQALGTPYPEGPMTPIYSQVEERFNSSSCKRVLFSPMYSLWVF